MPVSLSLGYLQTAVFKINVESTYALGIAVDGNSEYELLCRLGVQWCEYYPSMLDATWSVSRAGQIIARGTSEAEHDTFWLGYPTIVRRLGTFRATSGSYTVNVNLLKDGSQLNEHAPRLVVIELGGERGNAWSRVANAFLVCVLFFAVGTLVIVHSAIAQTRENWAALAKACSLTEPGPQSAIVGASRSCSATVSLRHYRETRPWSTWPFSRTSWYGLIGTNVYLVILIPVWLLSPRPMVPRGLVVHLVKPGIAPPCTPGIQPLRVRIAREDVHSPPKLYLDSRLVAWEDFGTVLQKEMSQRPPNWPVYVEGSGDMEWGHAVRAIDTIRGLQAQVVLLTPPRKSAVAASRR